MEPFWLSGGRELTLILAGYASGCFATGYYLVRWHTGQDIRRVGSRAAGGRNVAAFACAGINCWG